MIAFIYKFIDKKFIFGAINELLKTEKGKQIFRTLLLYLYYTTSIETNKIIETISNISLETQSEALTTVQKLLLDGKIKAKTKAKKK